MFPGRMRPLKSNEMTKWIGLLLLAAVVALAGCRDAGEFMGFTGKPQGDDGWREDYQASPQDVWEAIRLVVRDNGTLTEEDPEEMTLTGIYKPADSKQRDGLNMRAAVYDKSEGDELHSRLIVHAWYQRQATDNGRPDTAREYCNAVFRVLKAWKGEDVDEDPSVTTTSEDPVGEDEAIGFYEVTPDQAFAVCKEIVAKYGEVEQADDEKRFLRGSKQNPLENSVDDVRVNVYDRTEDEGPRAKVSVRVRSGEESGEPLQDVAKSYLEEIRKELQKRHGPQE